MDTAKAAREQGRVFNPMFVSAPGIGKSQITVQWAKKHGYQVIDLRFAYMEAPDLIGMCATTTVNGRNLTVNYLPEFWPQDPNSKGVLILEEINRAPQSVLNACMQLLTDRKVHNYTLPEQWLIVSCINPENSEYDVNSMDFALKDRFEIFEIDYDKELHVSYMKEKKFDNDLVMFVESSTWIYKKPEDVSNIDGMKYLSPRSVEKFDTALKAGIPKELEFDVYQSMLGKITGKDLYAFKKNERPITFFDLKEKPEHSKNSLIKYSDPENYKSGLISITVKDLVDHYTMVDDEMLASVCLIIPADKAIDLIKQLEYKTKDNDLLNRLCNSNKELVKKFKSVLKKDKK